MGQSWQPEQIMSDFETSLIPAVAAEVKILMIPLDTSAFVLVPEEYSQGMLLPLFAMLISTYSIVWLGHSLLGR